MPTWVHPQSYWFVLAVATLVALAGTPVVRAVAARLGLVARPTARSMHRVPVPHLGGLAIFAGFVTAVGVSLGWGDRDVLAVLLGGVVMLAVGLADDLWDLPPLAKLAGQVAAALVAVGGGIRIQVLTNPLGWLTPAGGDDLLVLGAWGIPLTVLWIVAVSNVINLIDGLDGLAAGIASIAALTVLVVAMQTGQPLEVVLLMAALAGSTMGFLPYNFNPAKIFMGDTGALFIGYTLAAVSVVGLLKTAAVVALAVPIIVLALPIADTALAILRRLQAGRPVMAADRDHLHHRLIRLGFSHRDAVLVMYLITTWLALGALAVAEGNLLQGLLIVVTLGASVHFVARKLVEWNRQRPRRLGH
ncbi:Glycosyl transferase, family 4, conserved region [Thermaerobacter marianensis DSM 12885]|uniref:Glycosyl transferase, family 4, conserved region n=1 Tax=Thermaerobacter marianensis (strain ATCC 700841 / DSM 12885 / JCM 10246 / 7p75a) TaxID=644966 RepID=E6SLL7_THEM7|nr:MraY family glycosyltransferase [Thermaerobacter marianensis]ADU50284.1 Glycosyl transferase, family 4, conserved region [Thermaerobacter marianensis DSM 12885]